MLEREFVFRKRYCHFSVGDKGRVVEVIQCECCEEPLVIYRVVDNKNSKFIWIEQGSLDELIQ